MQEQVHADVPKTIIREGGTSQYLLYAEKRKNTEKQMSGGVKIINFFPQILGYYNRKNL